MDVSSFGCWELFLGFFWGPKNTWLDVSVLGGLASESGEMREPEPAKLDFGTGTVGTGRSESNWSRFGFSVWEPFGIELNRGLHALCARTLF